MDYFVLVIAAIFVNNIVLAQYLGNCPFIGTSKDSGVAIGMGLAVVFVAAMAAVITWCVQKFLLAPNDLGYLQTIAFILVIAALVQFVELFLKKAVPPLYRSLGIFPAADYHQLRRARHRHHLPARGVHPSGNAHFFPWPRASASCSPWWSWRPSASAWTWPACPYRCREPRSA